MAPADSGTRKPGDATSAPASPTIGKPAPAPWSPAGVPAVGSLTYAAEQAAKAVGSNVVTPAVAAPIKAPAPVHVTAPDDGSPSSLRVALLAMALLAAAVLVVVGLFRLSNREQETNVEAEGKRLGLPAFVASTTDAAEPSVLTTDEGRAWLADFEKGGALLFFADLSTPEGAETAEIAVEMHRRLRGRDGLRVALVVPAAKGTSPAASDATAAVREGLRRRALASDLTVLVDPVDDSKQPGLWRRTRFDVPEDAAAVLVEDGLQAMRVSPPAAGMALTRSHVAPLVREAFARHPPSPPVGAIPVDEDPSAGEGDTVPERTRKPSIPTR